MTMLRRICGMMMLIVLALMLTLTLTACGDNTTAATMPVETGQEQVEVTDGFGSEDVEVGEDEVSDDVDDANDVDVVDTVDESEYDVVDPNGELIVWEDYDLDKKIAYKREVPLSQVVDMIKTTTAEEAEKIASSSDSLLADAYNQRFVFALNNLAVSESNLKDDTPYLTRWGEYYTLWSSLRRGESGANGNYNAGYYVGDNGGDNTNNLYSWFNGRDGYLYTFSYGDVTVPIAVKNNMITPEEKIIMRSSGYVRDMTLTPTQDAGYTIGIISGGNASSSRTTTDVYDIQNLVKYSWNSWDGVVSELKVVVKDTGEELPTSDIIGLEYGTVCIVSWYEGTEYHELEMPATFKLYRNEKNADIVLPRIMTKEGYAMYDYSEVPPGKYVVNHGGIIDIR